MRPPSLNEQYETLVPTDINIMSPTHNKSALRNTTLVNSPQKVGELIVRSDMNSPMAAKSPKNNNNEKETVKGLNFTPGYGINLDHYKLDQNIKLVPCRWSSSGWKYVEDEPSEQRFFRNPNKVNIMGHLE